MHAQIRDALDAISDGYDVDVLAARDYGSRARNLAGPTSDYDVFYLYLEDHANHVANTSHDTINDDSYGPDVVELHGWSLEKFVSYDAGLKSSNPMALEFVSSPVEYYLDDRVADPLQRLFEHARDQFKPYALIQHLRSKAASNYGKYIEHGWVIEASQEELVEIAPDGITTTQTTIDGDHLSTNGDLTVGILGYDDHTASIPIDEARRRGLVRRTSRDPSVKRNLTVLEALLHARYVEHGHDLPPMDIDDLLPVARNTFPVPLDVMESVEHLIDLKRGGQGGDQVGNVAGDWIERELGRDIEAADHVQRSPDADVIGECVSDVIGNLDSLV